MTVRDILNEVEDFVVKEVSTAETAVADWWKGFEPILADDFAVFCTAMKPIALNLITGLATAALSGPAKFAAVSAALLAAAVAAGIAATKTMADTLVQQIVVSLSAKKTA